MKIAFPSGRSLFGLQGDIIAQRLQTKWLEHMDRLLDAGTITSTDMATLARVLLTNGWTLDPKKLPKSLRDLLTQHVMPDEFADETRS